MNTYNQFKKILEQVADVEKAMTVLHWDQETYLPTGGSALRARQISTLAGMVHNLKTSDELGQLLNNLSEDKDLSFEQKRNVEEAQKNYIINKKYPAEFVIEITELTSKCFNSWVAARKANDFSLYRDDLEKMVALKRREAEILGYKDHPYDALLDQFEPGAKTAEITLLFEDVRAQLVNFVKEINKCPKPESEWMFKHYDKDTQWGFGIDVLNKMGFDFTRGRQDYSAHPFTISFGSDDVRVTTRVNENNFAEMLWSCIHEGGHALYEQGLKADEYGMPNGDAASLAIHESQSRIWENNVGRGIHFWKYFYAKLVSLFPENLQEVSLQKFYHSMNLVQPSLIRTNADELTYHFHILVRFELEKALIEGSLKVADIPAAWNKKYKEYLDIDVPSDAMGCLQDVHWSHGSFGYFPTYSLGSFYAAQFYKQAVQDIDGLEQEIAVGNFDSFLNWLRKNIHQYGKIYTADELCVRITGEKLNFRHFMDYAEDKYGRMYAIPPKGAIA